MSFTDSPDDGLHRLPLREGEVVVGQVEVRSANEADGDCFRGVVIVMDGRLGELAALVHFAVSGDDEVIAALAESVAAVSPVNVLAREMQSGTRVGRVDGDEGLQISAPPTAAFFSAMIRSRRSSHLREPAGFDHDQTSKCRPGPLSQA